MFAQETVALGLKRIRPPIIGYFVLKTKLTSKSMNAPGEKMAILITSGFEKNWCAFAQSRLLNMGINASSKSKRNELDALGLMDKMCNAYKVSTEHSRTFRQIKPGTAWQITAADLVVENSAAPDWGWADSRNLFFLDFWKDFDPSCKFVLVYGALHQSIARHIKKKGKFPKLPDTWISRWTSYHSELLRFYHANSQRCVLVHISEFSGNTNALARQLQSTLKIPAKLINSEEHLQEDSLSILAANQILQEGGFENDEHIGLYEELENAANLPDTAQINANAIVKNALKKHKASQKNVELLKKKLDSQKQIAGRLANDMNTADKKLTKKTLRIEKLKKVIRQKDTLLESLAQEYKQNLIDQGHSKSNEISTLKAQLESQADVQKENELLLLQLHQVQEELEHYFLEFQQLKSPNEKNIAKNSYADKETNLRLKGKNNITVDFRSFVDGTGWHSPENVGRWAGISNESTIVLPTLEPGQYVLNAKIVDGMSTSILKDLEILLNDKIVRTSRKLMVDLTGPLAPVRRLRGKIGLVEKPYPVEIKGNFSIPEKSEHNNSHLLSFKVPSTISPAKSGGQDTRDLSLCFQSLEIAKI